MKTFAFIPSILLSLTLLTACTPDDNNLNRPPSFSVQGQNVQNLRVGTYGQAIWAVQNVEQVGTLMQVCLHSENYDVQELNGKLVKECDVGYSSELNPNVKDTSARLKEVWTIKLLLEKNAADYSILQAKGTLARGNSSVQYKSINAYMQYEQKNFSYKTNKDQGFKLEVYSEGSIGSKVESFKFTHEMNVEGQLADQAWEIKKLDHVLELLDKGQNFNLFSNDIKLNWVTPQCAEPMGEITVSEAGKSSARIALTADQAKQLAEPGKKASWSQKTRTCLALGKDKNAEENKGKREIARLNFEFLFY